MPEQEKRYGTKITTLGASRITACILAGTKLKITQAAVGDGGGGYYVPTVDQTELRGELWRGPIVSAVQNPAVPNMLDVKIVIDDSVGNFICRETGLYSEDGALIAVCNTPDTEKVAISTGVNGRLTMVMHIVVADASVLEFNIVPALDMVSREDLENAIAEHNADPSAHAELFKQLTILDDTGKIPESYLPDGALKQDGVLIRIITIPVSAWREDPDGPCAYRAEVSCEESTEAHIPYVSLDGPSMGTAVSCGLWDKAEAAEGVLRFWAESVPEADIIARAALFGPGGGTSAGSSDGLKLGSGLKKNPDGTISVDVASEAEITEMLNGVFAPDNK